MKPVVLLTIIAWSEDKSIESITELNAEIAKVMRVDSERPDLEYGDRVVQV